MKKNLLIFSIAFIMYFLTKVTIFFLAAPIDTNINFYSIAAYISLILYIMIFIKLFKIIIHRKSTSLHNTAKNLYSTSVLLLSNSILASAVEVIKIFNMLSLSYDKSPKSELLQIIANNLLREVGLVGYLTMSLCFFLIIRLFYNNFRKQAKGSSIE